MRRSTGFVPPTGPEDLDGIGIPTDVPQVDRLVSDLLARRIDRRQFVRLAVALGLSLPTASALLAACAPASPSASGQATAAASATGAASAVPSASAAVPAKLTLRLTADIANLDPAFYPSSVDESVYTGIYEGLVAWKPGTFDVVNQLAATFEPSADGLSSSSRSRRASSSRRLRRGHRRGRQVLLRAHRRTDAPRSSTRPTRATGRLRLKEVSVEDKLLRHDHPQGAVRPDHALDAADGSPAIVLEEGGRGARREVRDDPIGTGPVRVRRVDAEAAGSTSSGSRTTAGPSTSILGSPLAEMIFVPDRATTAPPDIGARDRRDRLRRASSAGHRPLRGERRVRGRDSARRLTTTGSA